MAATAVKFKLTGDQALARSMRAADRGIRDASAPAAASADLLAGYVRRAAPRRSGALIGSVSAAATATSAAVTVGVRYAAFPEFGTRRMRARPYFRPSLDHTFDQMVQQYAAHVDRELSTVKGA